MDFGVMALDGLMVGSGSEQAGLSSSSSLCVDPETKQHKWYGSGLFLNKQERSENNNSEDDWKTLKVAKTNEEDFSASKAAAMLFLDHQQRRSPSVLRSSNNNSLFSADNQQQQQQQQQMLSFSSPKSEAMLLRNESSSAYPYSAYTNRNTGYNSGSLNAASMHGLLAGVRGPFTPSQWMELEHQALIYKYINANVPIPSNLLIPIKKALDSAGFSTFSGIPLRPNPLGWGSFHMGFSNSTDPEPGRCRRTDGKKWRCSRDAVADQKYCERHMNRGRHRSRKPVEGQTGHSVASSSNTTTNTTTTKLMSIPSSSSASVVIGGSGGAGSGMTRNHQQVKNLQPGASNTSAATHINNRIFMNKENLGERVVDTPVLSMLSSPTTSNLNSKHNSFSILKQQQQQQRMPYEESLSRTDFGLVSSDYLLNPSSNKSYTFMNSRNYAPSSNKSYTFMNSRNYAPSKDLNNERAAELQNPLRHFMDDWPKNQPETSSMSWPADIGMQSDRTQLSISIPMAARSDFMSSTTSSPTNERPTLSPLRLSREFNSTTPQMGLGVGAYNEENHRQANWIPISWETSMGGPLGEVLHNTSNTNKIECKNTSALNLNTEGWENSNSPRLGSSPTGVLQKTAFGSLSNSSAGSSPRAENNNNNNKTHEGSSLCNNDLGMMHREN